MQANEMYEKQYLIQKHCVWLMMGMCAKGGLGIFGILWMSGIVSV